MRTLHHVPSRLVHDSRSLSPKSWTSSMITCPPRPNLLESSAIPNYDPTRLDPRPCPFHPNAYIQGSYSLKLLESQTLDVGKRTHPRLPLAACFNFLYLVYLLIIYLLYPVRLSDLFGFEERGWGRHDIISSVRWMFTSRSLLSRIVMNW